MGRCFFMENFKELKRQIYVKQKTEEELNKTATGIRYFLAKVHPTLVDGSDKVACVGILPIQRNKSIAGFNFDYNRPLVLWKWDEKTEERLINFLKDINGQPVDLYYGVFNFDYNQETLTQAGKTAMKGIVNNQNSRYSYEFFMDFDDCNEVKYFKYRKVLESIGIECLWVFTGHGYQAHILLDEKNNKEYNYLLRFVYIARSRGFNIDSACKDSARKSRLPQWTNYKCWEKEKYNYEIDNPPKTKGVANTDKRYSIQEVFSKIETLPIINPQELDKLKDMEKQMFLETQNDLTLADTDLILIDTNVATKNKKLEELKHIDYKYIDIKGYPAPIQKMLLECRTGFHLRNKALGFLVKWFKSYAKLSKENTRETLEQWHMEATTYIDSFGNDFERFWGMNGLSYSSELATEFGWIDFQNISFLKKERDIQIANSFIDVMGELEQSAIKVYLAIKMTEHMNKDTDIENIVSLSTLSQRTVFRGLEILKNKHHIYVEKKHKYKKDGEVYIYKTQKIMDINRGYTILTYDNLKCMIIELKNNSIKLYLYMLRKCFNNKFCTVNQDDLAVAIGVARSTITGITKNLEKKNYIKIEKLPVGPNIYSNGYKLKR